jgi:hypothetical protein
VVWYEPKADFPYINGIVPVSAGPCLLACLLSPAHMSILQSIDWASVTGCMLDSP